MKITISFKHLEHTPAVDKHIRDKSKHFKKYLDNPAHVRWICYMDETIPRMHVAQVHVNGPKGDHFVTAKSENFYKCIDEAVEKMEKQLRKHKEKWKSRLHDDHEVIIRDPEQAWGSYPEVSWGDFKKAMHSEQSFEKKENQS
ncbi:MAG: ribosomal subunit interface protein [Bdellovibrionales bacterium GWA2_49_15]|nr:MAG: ribosomal subunit interface protein [Bdellovibrionales bacterium GWA2_49_15]HAZ13592.1 ribosome-associated translation inhibitor RaiA [Bdellovibrionales bacterium]